ncbi:hypothetical protein VPNG_09203 [Cytospora leucostoma]|uniref:Rhodopsin domain-containing protein n=1 Tax=Cytospora leucostoma TaxID=1230097 RepID=A0A423VUA4_9PEZI|nr:hypothetical protein VPNG_09203 [Cytospora leucostoma]
MSLTPDQIAHQFANREDNVQPNIYAACGGDDYTILVALLFTTAFVGMCVFITTEGMGKHAILMNPEYAISLPKGMFASEVIYVPALMTTKISILLLYRRIFPSHKFRMVLWCVGGFILAFAITGTFLQIFQCIPIEAIWYTDLARRCVNISADYIAMGTINIVTDVVVLCLPMPQLWRLQMSRTRKAQLMGMFLLGGFVCVVSIIRLTYLSNVGLSDATWNDAFTALWSVVETCIAIVCACLPTLRPLFDGVFSALSSAKHARGRFVPSEAPSANTGNSTDWLKLEGISASSGRSTNH